MKKTSLTIKRDKRLDVYNEIFQDATRHQSRGGHPSLSFDPEVSGPNGQGESGGQNGTNAALYEDQVRKHYQPLLEMIAQIGPEMMRERSLRADEIQAQEGITFLLNPGEERIIPVDWIPRIIPGTHWKKIDRGLQQRAMALNLFLKDIYSGRIPVVPEEIVKTSQYYYPECEGLKVPENIYMHLYGPDLVHLGDGRYVILEDNLRIPSGASYVMKWQRVIRHLFPEFLSRYIIQPTENFCRRFRENLEFAVHRDAPNDPVVVLLTEGSYSSAYYDHKYLAEQMGISLVEPRDLFIDEENRAMMKTNRGNLRVNMIYRRVQDLDLFVPGLSESYLAGKVNLANFWGSGVADDKAVFPYIPELIRHYLNEDPILENAPTYSLADPQQRKFVLSRMEKMVVKCREGYGGHDILIGPESSAAEIESYRQKIVANPIHYIAQDCLDFSAHVRGLFQAATVFNDAFVDFRAYVLTGGKDGSEIYVWPTGLTRIAQEGTRVVNSSSGGLIKGTWVLKE